MSAADRIEAIADVVVSAEQGQEIAGLAKASPTVLRMMADLRAIAAELRTEGAPVLTEAEREAIAWALGLAERATGYPEWKGDATEPRDKKIALLRALRTERTPSEGG